MTLEVLDMRETPAQQNYATHSIYRFYGKLPPLVVAELIKDAKPPILDIMCGSGTVLVESVLAGKECIGLDINPLCTLLSKVKTTPLEVNAIEKVHRDLEQQLVSRNASPRASFA